jgi:rare lipoprotein A
MNPTRLLPMLLCACFAAGAASADAPAPGNTGQAPQARHAARHHHKLDLSGRRRVGKASIYAHKFAGRKMADGHRMNPRDGNAASKTLPLGTVAKVTNLDTGRSAVVTIRDRGPHVDGRIVDLSPGTAEQIGLAKEQGIAPVAVTPIAIPQPDGSVKPGDAAADQDAANS